MTVPFPPLRFRGELRSSQRDAIKRRQPDGGHDARHIVA